MSDDLSCVLYLPSKDASKCGYCKSKNAKQYGLWAYDLRTDDYQSLIDRGWRRCGSYCYKPILNESCCALYTIRCAAVEFRLSRSQKRVMKRMNNFLQTGDRGKSRKSANIVDCSGNESVNATNEMNRIIEKPSFDKASKVLENIPKSSRKVIQKPIESVSTETVKGSITAENHSIKKPMKAKQLRIERKREKLRAKGYTKEEIEVLMVKKKRYPKRKELEDFIDVVKKETASHQLEVRVTKSSPESKEFEETFMDTFNLYVLYQTKVHADKKNKVDDFRRFLVESPLISDEIYGSHHMQYLLDGNLIAVGVIDILPNSVSSVYLYYHPDYAFLNLGTYAALREIAFVRSLAITNPNLLYYYMGFYIHTCPKMRYKGAYQPSFLLCPELYTWHLITDCIPNIEKYKYSKFNNDPTAVDEENDPTVEVPLDYQRMLVLSKSLPDKMKKEKALIAEYIALVGKTCAQRMILQLH